MNTITKVSSAITGIAFASVFVVISASFGMPTTAHAQTYGDYSSGGCCGDYGSSYSDYSYTPDYGTSNSDYSYTPDYGTSNSDYSYTPDYGTSNSDYSYTPDYGSSYSDYSYTPDYGTSNSDYNNSTSDTSWVTTGYQDSYPSYDTADNTSWVTTGYQDSYPSYSYDTSYDYSTPSYTYSTPSYTYSYPTYTYTTPTYTATGGNNPVAYQPTCNISANPSSVSYGGSTTLSWSSSYGTSATLSGVGSVSTNGSYTISNITGTHTYVLTVYGNGGTNTCSTSVTAQQPVQQTPYCNISANPNSIQNGGSSTVTWNSSNATSATLSGVGSVSTNGSYTFNNLSGSQTYTLTVSGQGGTNTCSTSVNVSYPQQTPYCSLTITPIVYGSYNYNNYYNGNNNAYTLSWTASNATSASIDGIGSVSAYSGSRTIYPTYSQTYTMHVYGQNGQSNSCTGYVNVQPAPTNNLSCSISASQNYVTSGGSTLLTWTSVGAAYASLSDGIGSVSTNGSLAVNPTDDTFYMLTVRDYNGNTQTCSTNVNVNGGTYVSLTQIPYTGFDFGPVGDAIYWTVLAAGALAATYFVTTYRGGVMNLAFAGISFGKRNQNASHIVASEDEEPADDEELPAAVEETVTEENEDDHRTGEGVGDAMAMDMTSGMPRLVITRSRTGAEGLPGQN